MKKLFIKIISSQFIIGTSSLAFFILMILVYFKYIAPRHVISIGPVAQILIKQEPTNIPTETENLDVLIEIVHDLLKKSAPGIEISKDRISTMKGKNGYFRIMGGFEQKDDETIIFIIVLKDGNTIYRELGNYLIEGTYPIDAFPLSI